MQLERHGLKFREGNTVTDTTAPDLATFHARIAELEAHEKELLAHIQEQMNTATINEQMAQVLEDVNTLCDTGEFNPEIFLDFIREGEIREFMQYHSDYH